MCIPQDRQTRTLFFFAMIALLLSSAMQIPTRLYPAFHPDLMDGLHGLFLGVAISGMLVTAWRNGRGRRA